MTASVRPRPDERLADRVAGGERRLAPVGHRRRREARRHVLVAVDAGDLLGEVRLDLDVAAPRRHGGDESPRRAGAATTSGSPPAAIDDDLGPRAGRRGLDADPREHLALRVGAEVRAQQPVDARRPERDACAAPGSVGLRVDRPRSDAPPAHSAMSRAARSAPRRASRNSWPFSKRRLASERSA